jgi:type IV pilus assembly protein PilV
MLNKRFHTGSTRAPGRIGQRGIAMVEAMVAIVIFSIGVLGIVGMQARSTQMLTDGVFRAQAAQVASQLIAEMWTADPSKLALLYSSASSGTRYNQWRANFQSGSNMIPGSSANPPTVVVQSQQIPLPSKPGVNFTTSDVTITIFWQRPGGVVSQYVTTARILEPQS